MSLKVGDIVLLTVGARNHLEPKMVAPRGLKDKEIIAWRKKAVEKPFIVTKMLTGMGMLMVKSYPNGGQLFPLIPMDVDKILTPQEIEQFTSETSPEDKPSI